jgi:hypothetical protein
MAQKVLKYFLLVQFSEEIFFAYWYREIQNYNQRSKIVLVNIEKQKQLDMIKINHSISVNQQENKYQVFQKLNLVDASKVGSFTSCFGTTAYPKFHYLILAKL